MIEFGRRTRFLFGCLVGIVLVWMYLPMATIALASVTRSKYFAFPVRAFTDKWYGDVLQSLSIRGFLSTSLVIALLVALFSTGLAFFGALAFARYRWTGRKLFQRIILLPILFPQGVLGLALLLWFNAVGVSPSWPAAVFAHLVWIAPVTTLVIAIQVYGFDPALEEAAFDLGASRWQVMREVTLPLLLPGIVSGFFFAFLLSWANFPLSMFATGPDQTIPEWIGAKVQSGYTPQVPAVGTLMMLTAGALLSAGYGVVGWRNRRRRIAVSP